MPKLKLSLFLNLFVFAESHYSDTLNDISVNDIYEINCNTNLMQQGNFIDVFLARYVSGTYAHHQEH